MSTRLSAINERAAGSILIAAVTLALLAGGCSKHASAPAAPGASDSGWKLGLTVSPKRPRMVRPASFTVHIADSTGLAIGDAMVTGSLNMTLMDMGKTEVKFEPKGNGDYEASVKSFDMSGPWELAVDAVQGSTKTHRVFQFNVFD
ncbi:MAG TPA: FixH family protein [Candidatus Eisenbacteria bacterium]|nr:FixH family protein [Candidatus Eisenbacteria bacterium]